MLKRQVVFDAGGNIIDVDLVVVDRVLARYGHVDGMVFDLVVGTLRYLMHRQ